MRREVLVQLVEDDAGLGADPSLVGVYLDHPAHVLGEVEHDRAAHRLSGEAGAASAGKHGDAVMCCGFDHRDDVLLASREHHADGLDLVDAGVGAVEGPRHGVETDLALDQTLQVFDKGARIRRHGVVSHLAPGGPATGGPTLHP